MKDIAAIILAAGRGKRMKSDVPKALQEVGGRPILDFLVDALSVAGVEKKVLVVGYKDTLVKSKVKGVDCVRQDRLLGSADAVKAARGSLSKFKGAILVLCADTPLITAQTIKRLVNKHRSEKPSCTFLTASVEDPSGYGRVLRDLNDNVVKIVEERDASVYERAIDEINAGCYCFRKDDLFSYIDRIRKNERKKEYYLTDIIEALRNGKKKVLSLTCKNPMEALGINSKSDLAMANEIIRKRVLERLMLEGVTVLSPDSTFIDMEAKIGKDTVIHPHTIIEKDVVIGARCQVGPFARIRPGTRIDDSVEVGNFVELVRAKLSSGVKVKHTAYLGDVEIGRNVNIGAGTITANFDGKNKNKTIIDDGAFIGVGSIFIAPVRVGSGAIVGAGSVVTKGKDVPPRKIVAGVPARVLGKK